MTSSAEVVQTTFSLSQPSAVENVVTFSAATGRLLADLIEGIYRLLLSDETEPVNIGNPTEITIQEFAERINALTDNAGGIRYEPLPKDDPRQRRPDIGKARRILGWEPKVELAEGLAQTVAWFADRVPAST